MKYYDVIHFCFDCEICTRVLGVQNVQNNLLTSLFSLHEIDIQSQQLAGNVLNRASILLSNRIQSFFPIVQWIFELFQC